MNRSYRDFPGWESKFGTTIHHLLTPDSELARAHSYLHHVLYDRLTASLHAREDPELSKCSHKIQTSSQLLPGWFRSDSRRYQNVSQPSEEPRGEGRKRIHYDGICADAMEKYNIDGHLGTATFGSAFLAQERTSDPDQIKRVAIKVQWHQTNRTSADVGCSPSMAGIVDNGELRYIPCEAVILLLLTHSDRFPTLHSVYTHGEFHSIVMSACMDQRVLLSEEFQLRPDNWPERIPAFSGKYLLYQKRPVLNEIQACKVSSQLLEANAYLRDMNIAHDDLSHQNYIVDEDLNVYLIDFGNTKFALEETNFQSAWSAYVPYLEYQLSPELAIELEKEYWDLQLKTHGTSHVSLSHDVRQTNLWRFATLVYSILHGFAPWEDSEWDGEIRMIQEWRDRGLLEKPWQELKARRKRMINEEMPIDEKLSQDCLDALQMMLAKDTEQRPTLIQLMSFPWLEQWCGYAEAVFQRPHVQRYEDHLPWFLKEVQASFYV